MKIQVTQLLPEYDSGPCQLKKKINATSLKNKQIIQNLKIQRLSLISLVQESFIHVLTKNM